MRCLHLFINTTETIFPSRPKQPPRQGGEVLAAAYPLREQKKAETTEATVGLRGIVVAHNKEEFLPFEICQLS